jgi:asparagine synthase (glutamine-hydrolysing)
MCGIIGFQSKEINNKEELINIMLNTIKHRGPDDEGFFANKDIALGHVRLAIIDLAHAKQPMHSKDGRYCIVFNGEIYNYLELRKDLVAKGYSFQTHSDTEVLLNMYIEYGAKSLSHINGMFAFAIYDQTKKELFLARDPFGVKPLYYCCNNNNFVFASEIKALLKYPNIKAEIDEHSLYEYLTFQFVLDKHTLFNKIYKLEPAHYIIVKNNNIIDKKEYWTPNYSINENITQEEAADQLLCLLDNSINIQTRADVPLGSYLSGGLDSSIVSLLASKNYFGQFNNFTGAFKDSLDYDETNYAKILNQKSKSKLNLIYPTHKDFIKNFEKIIYHLDEPCGGPGVFPQYMVSKLASKHVKVVLGGQGGDEIFGGYTRYLVAYLEQCIKGAILETQEEGKHIITLKNILPNMPSLKKYLRIVVLTLASIFLKRAY